MGWLRSFAALIALLGIGGTASAATVSTTSADAIYSSGSIVLTIDFGTTVTVSGLPQLQLETGAVDRQAVYSGGSGSSVLQFTYTITGGDVSSDLDYVSSSALTLNGGSINTGSGPASLTLPVPGTFGSLSYGHQLVIDTNAVRPGIVNVTSPSADGTYGAHKAATITVQFGEPVHVTGAPTLSLNSGGTAIYSGGDLTNVLSFTYLPVNPDASADLEVTAVVLGTATITDGAGNASITLPTSGGPGSLSYNKNIVVETTAPVVTNVSSAVADVAYGLGASIPITVTFSEPVFVAGGTPTLTLETGSDTVVNYTSGSGSDTLTFTYVVGSGQNSADLDYILTTLASPVQPLSANGATIRDAATNDAVTTLATAGAANSLGSNKDIVIDTRSPRIDHLDVLEGNGTYSTGQLHIRVFYDEPVFITGMPKLKLETGTIDQTASYSSGSGTSTIVFTYSIVPGDSTNALEAFSTTSLTLNGGTMLDGVGNPAATLLPAPGSGFSISDTDPAVVVDTQPAVVNVDSTVANKAYSSGTVIPIRLTFSSSVTVTGVPSLALNSASGAQATYASGSPGTQLIFNYNVLDGDSSADLDYSSSAALALNGGTIVKTSAPGIPAFLTLLPPGGVGSLGANKDIVIDGLTPGVDHVTSSVANASYGVGSSIPIQVVFNEPVVVTGTPQLALALGGTSVPVDYASGTGTATLVFTYVVAAGQTSSDLQYVSTTSLSGGTIKNGVNTPAVTTLPPLVSALSLGGGKDIVIDTVAPAVTSVTGASPDGTYGVGQTVDIRVSFGESVNVLGSPRLALNDGAFATYLSGTGTSSLIFRYTVATGDTQPDLNYASTSALTLNGGTIRDAAGNDANLALPAVTSVNSLAGGAAIVISTVADATAPSVSAITASPTTATYVDGDDVVITITFSEPVGVVGAPFLVLNDIGSSHVTPVAGYTSGSGTAVLVFTYTVGAGNTTDELDSANAGALRLGSGGSIKDAAGNDATLTVPVGAATGSLAANTTLAVNPGPAGGKPPPGTAISTEANSGGCGLGGGAALIAGLALFLRGRRRIS